MKIINRLGEVKGQEEEEASVAGIRDGVEYLVCSEGALGSRPKEEPSLVLFTHKLFPLE